MATWRFRFISSFAGESEYEAIGSGGISGRVTYRYEHVEYFRQIYTGGPDAYDREAGPTLYTVRWTNFLDREMSQEIVDAFNAWREASHDEAVATIKANPEKYGALPDNDPLLAPIIKARGIGWDGAGKGWLPIAA